MGYWPVLTSNGFEFYRYCSFFLERFCVCLIDSSRTTIAHNGRQSCSPNTEDLSTRMTKVALWHSAVAVPPPTSSRNTLEWSRSGVRLCLRLLTTGAHPLHLRGLKGVGLR